MGALDGRIAIITGAGRGIGREHALLFASEGASVVVNDLGGAVDGSGDDRSPAQQVVDEITAAGGRAVANADDICDWEGGKRLIDTAVEAFGDLHVLVNNAGILRDRVLVNMSEEDWDSVIHVHLKGHFVPTRHAAAYWREQTKAGHEVKASVVNTSSTSGLLGNPGQSNYGAAKAGIAAFTTIAADELVRYGVRVNAIAPAARTRMTEQTPGLSDIVRGPRRRLGVRQLGSGQRLAPGGVPGHRGLPSHRPGVLRPGRPDSALPAVDDDRHLGKGRPVDGGGAPGPDAPARGLSRWLRPGDRAAQQGDQEFDAAEVIEAEALLSGTGAGAEGGIVVPWPLLFRHRIHHRLAGSERYQWWVLWTVLAGLLSVNITFTVFVVALPQVATELHTSISTLTWTSTGPLLAFGVAAPCWASSATSGATEAVPVGPGRAPRSAWCSPPRPRPPGCSSRPGCSTASRGRPPARRRWPWSSRSSPTRTGSRPWAGGPWSERGPGARGHHRRSDHPVLRVAGPLLGRAAPDGGGRRAGRGGAPRAAAARRKPGRQPAARRAGPVGHAGLAGVASPCPDRSPPDCWPSTWLRPGGSPPRPPWPSSP